MKDFALASIKNWIIEIGFTITAALFVRLFITRRMRNMEDKKEVEGKIGAGGTYFVDLKADGTVKAEATYSEGGVKGSFVLELDLIEQLEKLALSTENKIDDSIVGMVKGALGR